MACKTSKWFPEKRPDLVAALRTSLTRREAARKLEVSVPSLDHGCQVLDVDPVRELGQEVKRAPVVAPVASQNLDPGERNVKVTEVPAWQGYRPRPGWEEPKPAGLARAAAQETKRIAVIPDVHVPYQLRPAWSCALSVVREWKPHRVVIIGDFMDTESVSVHPKSKPDVVRLSEEYHEANLRLDELQNATPDATWVYIEGNHENRVTKWCTTFGSMDGMLDVPEALYMKPRDEGYHRSTSQLRGMDWVPLSRQPYVIEGVAYLHGVYESQNHTAQTARELLSAIEEREAVYGHMHTLGESVSPTVPGRSPRRATCCGFLGDATQPVFRSYVKGRPKPWDVGLLLQEVGGGLAANHPVRIVNGRALFGGRLVQAA